MATQRGLFDVEKRLRRLSDIGDQIEAYAAVVDFEVFRPDSGDGAWLFRRYERPEACV